MVYFIVFIIATLLFGENYSHHLLLLFALLIPFRSKDRRAVVIISTMLALVLLWVMFDAMTIAPGAAFYVKDGLVGLLYNAYFNK
ncbi:MAG: hypothetical protein IJH67_02590 [Thermoguttaceae bacterium]|nr:hypothetical protein [Thermoguttaceae bacterium]